MQGVERAKQLEYNLQVLKRRDAAITRVLDVRAITRLNPAPEKNRPL